MTLAPARLPFIRRLLGTRNALSETERLVEVVILSRNDPRLECGDAVGPEPRPDITRAIFMQGPRALPLYGTVEGPLPPANEADARQTS